MRIDKATLVLGLRVNLWMSLVVGGSALIVMIVRHRRNGPGDLLEDRYPAGERIEDEVEAEKAHDAELAAEAMAAASDAGAELEAEDTEPVAGAAADEA